MSKEIETYNPTEESVVVYRSADNAVQLDVQLADETVWLTQAQMAMLFDSTKQNVSLHINNIYKEGELSKEATVKDYLTVQNEGGRQITRRVLYYNLDVIISVGYRVKSKRGTQFRQWANRVLKDYLLRGYAMNPHLRYIEQRIDNKLQEHSEQILRIVQSIPSKKAEPLKRWLAQVGSERIQQMIDPELAIQQAVADYKKQGYPDY